jgi:hypothetical protein
VSHAENPHAGQGAVVLDIGGDVGALIVFVPAQLAGTELEICPAGHRGDVPDEGGDWWEGDWRSQHVHPDRHGPAWPHVAVLARPTSTGSEHAAVFPALCAGAYEVWPRTDGATRLVADVTGGKITTVSWP